MIARTQQLIQLTPAADHSGLEGYAVKLSSGNAAILTALTDVPFGVITEGQSTSGKDSIALPGFAGTVKVKLNSSPGTVNAGSYLEVAADGTWKVSSGTATHVRAAQAIEAGSANELIEARLCEPLVF